MIELDYNNEVALDKFVERSGYFAKPIEKVRNDYEKQRPKVVKIKQFKNVSKGVNPMLKEITIEFSTKMDDYYRNFEIGPLGEHNLLRLKKFIGYSADGRSATFEIELQPNRQYQLIVNTGFRSADGISLKPYLIDFKTAK